MQRKIPSSLLDSHDDLGRLLQQAKAVVVTLNAEGTVESLEASYVKDALWLVEDLLTQINSLKNHQWREIRRNF